MGFARRTAPTPYRSRKSWNEIHEDLDEALSRCGLSDCEQIYMHEARMRSYRPAKLQGLEDPIPFRINNAELAEQSGKSRKGISCACARLKKAGLIVPAPDAKPGHYLINKDFRTWAAPRKLNATQLRELDRLAPRVWVPNETPSEEPAVARPLSPPARKFRMSDVPSGDLADEQYTAKLRAYMEARAERGSPWQT